MQKQKSRGRKRKSSWRPVAGQYASYNGTTSKLLKGGKLVSVIAQAAAQKTLVEAIGYSGQPVRFTVNTSNLTQPQPSLFD